MNANEIRGHMDVVGACGHLLGSVDGVEGGSIKLTRDGDGRHHFIPLDWIDHVDEHVHLNKDCEVARQRWQLAPMTA
jgi:hypothetical protein